jgi:hypothetical protein
MGASIDLYKYDQILTKDVEVMEWVATHGSPKGAWLVKAEVDEEDETAVPMPAELVEAIKEAGFHEDDTVLVVYND